MIKYRHELLKHITKTLCLCIDCHFYIFANSCKIHFSNHSLATFESKKWIKNTKIPSVQMIRDEGISDKEKKSKARKSMLLSGTKGWPDTYRKGHLSSSWWRHLIVLTCLLAQQSFELIDYRAKAMNLLTLLEIHGLWIVKVLNLPQRSCTKENALHLTLMGDKGN